MKSDVQLLRRYVEDAAEDAFAEIVARHTSLVYSVALRKVNSPAVAADIAQAVFVGLVQSSSKLCRELPENAALAGWLCRTAANLSLKSLRDESRRQSRERLAMAEFEPTSNTGDDWTRLRPVLDDAIGELSDPDAEAVVLRYFENQDLVSVGRALGVSDDTAQKRVSRALDKLRTLLLRRGVATTAALETVLSANAMQAAPPGLAVSIANAAVLSGTTLTAVTHIAMTTLQKSMFAAALAALAGAGIYEMREASTLRSKLEQQAPLAQQVQALERERDAASQRVAALRKQVDAMSQNNLELVRLRGETGMLRMQTNRLAKQLQGIAESSKASSNEPTSFPRNTWTFAGFDSPEATLQSYMWAKSRGDVETAFATATPELKEAIKDHYFKGKTDAEIAAMLSDGAKEQAGFKIMNKLMAAEDQVVFQVHIDGAQEQSYALLTMKKIDGQWKVSSAEERTDTQP